MSRVVYADFFVTGQIRNDKAGSDLAIKFHIRPDPDPQHCLKSNTINGLHTRYWCIAYSNTLAH
jgi:hypothetical protein